MTGVDVGVASAFDGEEVVSRAAKDIQTLVRKNRLEDLPSVLERFDQITQVARGSGADTRKQVLQRLLVAIARPYDHMEDALVLRLPSLLKIFGDEPLEETFVAEFSGKGALTDESKSTFAFLVFRHWVRNGRHERVRRLLGELRALPHPFHYAAAVRALGSVEADGVSQNVDTATSELKREPRDESLFNSAATAWAFCMEEQCLVGGVPAKDIVPALRSIARTLKREELTPTSRLALGRMLARVLGSNRVYMDAQSWLDAIDGLIVQERLAREGYGVAHRPYGFMGHEIVGNRVVYVIDHSASMTDEIDVRAVLERFTKRQPKRSGETDGDRTKRVHESIFGKRRVDLDGVKTRWDFVRECLLASAAQLSASQQFEVILYSDHDQIVGVLGGERPRLRKATKGIKALLARRLRSDKSPFGGTQTWDALRVAYGPLSSARISGGRANRIEQEADTLVLLSDSPGGCSEFYGPPSNDNFHGSAMMGLGWETVWLFRDVQFYGVSIASLEEVGRYGKLDENEAPTADNYFVRRWHEMFHAQRGQFLFFY